DGRWGFRGFEAVETYGPQDPQGKRAKVVSSYDFTLDHSGRLVEVVTYEDSSSSVVDSVDQTIYEELHVLGDGDAILEDGEIRSIQAAEARTYTCKAGQTYAQCTAPSTAIVRRDITDWRPNHYSKPPVQAYLWVPGEVR